MKNYCRSQFFYSWIPHRWSVIATNVSCPRRFFSVKLQNYSVELSHFSPLLLHVIAPFDFSLCFRLQDGSSATPELTKTREKERKSPVKGVLVCDTLRASVVICVIYHINHTCAVILICPTGIMFAVRVSAAHPRAEPSPASNSIWYSLIYRRHTDKSVRSAEMGCTRNLTARVVGTYCSKIQKRH